VQQLSSYSFRFGADTLHFLVRCVASHSFVTSPCRLQVKTMIFVKGHVPSRF